jgi:hypothetical protein
MTRPGWLVLCLAGASLLTYLALRPAEGCCPAPPPSGKPVVNADQSVILIWDAASKTEHFIRRASFKSAADDFGFLVPTPAQPELNESGNEAFPTLQKLTEPETKTMPRPSGGMGCGCSDSKPSMRATAPVQVLQEKLVAGFNAAVLEAGSAAALVGWLRDHGYAYSPAVEAWARPYVEAGWKITALKVAKPADGREAKDVTASALRMTFHTDRPLFPYREPDSTGSAQSLGANHRLLRIYFLAEARYQGELTQDVPWTGRVAWAGKLSPDDRKRVLGLLGLPETTGPADWFLTEFEDPWPYRVAPADVYFSHSATQEDVRREAIIRYVTAPWPGDVMAYAIAAVLVVPPILTRVRRRKSIDRSARPGMI